MKTKKLIISTVGTSLLTNQIDRQNEGHWFKELSNYANETLTQVPDSVKEILEILKERAKTQLSQGNLAKIRRASAELNGIYGIYHNDLSQGKQDLHYLIATDTAQGQMTAEIVQDYLLNQGLIVNSYTPKGLSTANTAVFSEGIDQIIVWLQESIKPYQESYQIYFNLVGSFKSLQGYLNTLAMFYADAIAYIFEGENSELIIIPRLPITLDFSLIEVHKLPLLLMSEGAELTPSDYPNLPEALVYSLDNEMTLSTWGKLVWGEAKEAILSGNLIDFPRLVYEESFRADYNSTKDSKKRIKLQETLAKVSVILEKSKGNTAALRGNNAGGIFYDSYTGKHSGIDHFRLNDDWRVSCIIEKGQLVLRHFGKHDYVNNNP
jgi:putative CRISPR-associated protein (TIGR02619 family)